MPRYTELELKTGYVITEEWYTKLVDILEQITEQGAISYGGTVKSDIIPDVDLLFKIGKAGRRFLEAHAGYGYFSSLVQVGGSVKITPDKIIFPDASEQTKSADNIVADHEEKKTGVHGVGTSYIAKTSRSDQLPSWGDIPDKPSTFPPSAHADTHKDGGSDEVIGVLKTGTTLPTGQAGQFFLKTDTLEFYYHDGTDWVKVGRLAGLNLDAHASRHESGGADPIENLGRLLIGGTEVIDASRNLKNIASAIINEDLVVATDKIRTAYPDANHITIKAPIYDFNVGGEGGFLIANAYWDGSNWRCINTSYYPTVFRVHRDGYMDLRVGTKEDPTTLTQVFIVNKDGNLEVGGGGANVFRFKGASGSSALLRVFQPSYSAGWAGLEVCETEAHGLQIYVPAGDDYAYIRTKANGEYTNVIRFNYVAKDASPYIYGNLEVGGKIASGSFPRMTVHKAWGLVSAGGKQTAHRVYLVAGKTLKLWAVGGDSESNLGYAKAQIYNYTDDVVEDNRVLDYDVSKWDYGNPLLSLSYTADKILYFRVVNDGSTDLRICAVWDISVE